MANEWPLVGTRLAHRYRLAAQIEQGGMAVVWRAHDELLDREVAVKLLSGDVVGNAGLFDLVRREARASAKLSHSNITAVHDYAEAIRPDGVVAPFVVMELLDGETLAGRLHRGTLRWAEAAGIGVQVGRALAAAHKGGVVHRDITPGNVMLTSTAVKVVDFGISAAIGEPDEDGAGSTFGTPAYVAPERLDGLPALPATDVYGLGCLLFEMVTGQPPYPVDTWEELAIARTSPPGELPTDLPPAYAHIVRWCLAEQPAARPSAEQVARLLNELTRSPHTFEVPTAALAPALAVPALRRFRQARPGRPTSARTKAAVRQGGLLVVTIGMVALGAVAAGTRLEPSNKPAGPTSTPALAARPPAPAGAVAAAPFAGPAVTQPSASTLPRNPKDRRRTPAVGAPAATQGPNLPPAPPAPVVPPVPGVPPAPAAPPVPTAPPAPAPAPPAPTDPGGAPDGGGGSADAISVSAAVDRLAETVRTGLGAGEIRIDVAEDLLNVIAKLDRSDQADLTADVQNLRRKISDRQREGGVAASAAAALEARLNDLAASAAA